MTSIKITFSADDVVPQEVPKSQNASHICLSACTHGNTLGIQKNFSFSREESSLISCDMILIILKMRPKMALIDPSPLVSQKVCKKKYL